MPVKSYASLDDTELQVVKHLECRHLCRKIFLVFWQRAIPTPQLCKDIDSRWSFQKGLIKLGKNDGINVQVMIKNCALPSWIDRVSSRFMLRGNCVTADSSINVPQNFRRNVSNYLEFYGLNNATWQRHSFHFPLLLCHSHRAFGQSPDTMEQVNGNLNLIVFYFLWNIPF